MKRRNKFTTGQAMVEMALVFPFLCILLFGIIDLGAVMYKFVSLHSANRRALRVAAMNVPGTTANQLRGIIVSSAPGLELTSDLVDITISQTGDGLGMPTVQIAVRCQHEFFGPLNWLGERDFTLNSSMRSSVATWPGNVDVVFAGDIFAEGDIEEEEA